MIIRILDIIRIVFTCAAFFAGYTIGFANEYNPTAQLNFMIPAVIITIAGLSGVEGLLFSDMAAEIKGFEKGTNYQKQSAIGLLSYAFTAILVYISNWGIKAELAILFTFLFFLFFSGINHMVNAIRYRNYKWQNINRPIITLLLLAGFFYPVLMVLKEL